MEQLQQKQFCATPSLWHCFFLSDQHEKGAQFPPSLQAVAIRLPRAVAVVQEHRAQEVGAQQSGDTVFPLRSVYVSNISLEESYGSGDPVVRLSWGTDFFVYIYQ